MRHGQVDSLDILQIAAAWSGTQLVMRASGELDLCSAPQLRQALDEAADRMPSGVILDLELISFIDAAGIRAVLRGAELFGPRFVLRRTPAYVMRLFTIIGLEQQLTFEIDPGSE
ncbi:MAG: STAS domain-containing protein [Solirubrobacterales bacterium]|nr:STAS domain-containing protein [Solirubrobacterales bacterium]